MSWDDIEESGGNADYLKIESGKPVTVHLLDVQPTAFYQHWKKGDKSPVKCKGAACAYCANTEYDKKRRYAINVLNLETKQIQILEQGVQVFSQIKKVWESYDKKLDTVDMKISKSGSGLNTEYSVIPIPTKFDVALVAGKDKYQLSKLYDSAIETPAADGEIPF